MNEEMLKALQDEKDNIFKKFDAEDAFIIGSYVAKKAIENKAQICVDIYAYGRTLYHFSSDQCIPDNDNWLRRKRNTVLYFQHSSKYIFHKIKGDQTLLASKYGLKAEDYTAIHGGFPIMIESSGIVGAICVSGMEPEQDHQLILEAIKILK